MITESQFRGGADYLTAPSGAQIVFGRILRFAPASSVFFDLPDATLLRTGGPYFVIVNHGPSSVVVRDNEMSTVVTVASGTVVVVGLLTNGSAAGSWGTFVLRSAPKTMGFWSGREAVVSSTPDPVTPVDCNAPAYLLTPCSGQADETQIYTDTDLSGYLQKIVSIDGDTRCFTVSESDGRRVDAEAVTIDQEFDDCRDCRRIFKLTDCGGVASPVYTGSDLSSYDEMVVRIAGDSTHCWTVEEILFEGQSLTAVTVDCSFSGCSCCLENRQASGQCPCIRLDSVAVITWSATPAPGCGLFPNEFYYGGSAVATYDTYLGDGTNVVFAAYIGEQEYTDQENHYFWRIAYDNSLGRWSAVLDICDGTDFFTASCSTVANYSMSLNGNCSGSTSVYDYVNSCLGGTGQNGPMSVSIRVQGCRDNDTYEPEGV